LILVLFGPPGAGKGTQSLLISKKLSLTHVSTGDLLRTAIKNQTTLGVEAKKFVDAGELVPDSIMIGLIKDLMASNSTTGLLLDGFPRTVDQASALDLLLKDVGTNVRKAIFLEVPKHLLFERLTGRRVCTKCGTTFHLTMKPTKINDVCDVCNGVLEQRKDDKPEVIGIRLEVYEKNTLPLKAYYQAAKRFEAVDGVGEPELVFSRINKVVS
jgi:adenylate kinase